MYGNNPVLLYNASGLSLSCKSSSILIPNSCPPSIAAPISLVAPILPPTDLQAAAGLWFPEAYPCCIFVCQKYISDQEGDIRQQYFLRRYTKSLFHSYNYFISISRVFDLKHRVPNIFYTILFAERCMKKFRKWNLRRDFFCGAVGICFRHKGIWFQFFSWCFYNNIVYKFIVYMALGPDK